MFDQEDTEDYAHRLLRRELGELVDRQSALGPAVPVPVQEVLKQGRLHRRFRAGAVAGGVLACALAGGLLTQSLTGTAVPQQVVAAHPTASAVRTTNHHLPKRVAHESKPPRQPSVAVVGTAYPYDLNANCSEILTFAGRSWVSQVAVKLRRGSVAPRGPEFIPGYLTVTGRDTAQFEAPGYLTAPVPLRAAPRELVCA